MRKSPQSSLTSQDIALLTNSILKTLKEQQDRAAKSTVNNQTNISPAVLRQVNPSVFGPFLFQNAFRRAPNIAFGQARNNSIRVTSALVVMPYVDSWVSSSGGIIGFNLGVLALTTIPTNLSGHTIMWTVSGKASLYKDEKGSDNWLQAYSYDSASQLTADPGTQEIAG